MMCRMPHITLIAHNIRSTYNMGSLFRTADGLGVKKIIISGYTPFPKIHNDTRLPHIAEKTTKAIHKTALGAEEIVPFEYVNDIDTWMRSADMPIIALEQSDQSVPLSEFSPPPRFALLLGEEVDGVTADLLSLCDAIVEIPMKGTKESFNVSVAAAIALYTLSTRLVVH